MRSAGVVAETDLGLLDRGSSWFRIVEVSVEFCELRAYCSRRLRLLFSLGNSRKAWICSWWDGASCGAIGCCGIASLSM